MSFGGFGAKPAAGAPAFGAAPAASGGFGAPAPATAAAGGFGAQPATAGGTGFGFGGTAAAAPATATGGFGSTAATTAAAGGFGAKPMTTTPVFGAAPAAGFGAPAATTGGFGAGSGTTGFGAPRTGGFGGGGGFGVGGGGGWGAPAAAAAAPTGPTAAQYPYPGIKGPGNSMTWAREVDFSRVMEQTPFEGLPQPLQQHLLELRTFMHTERDAARKVYEYLNETDKPAVAGAAAAAAGASAKGAADGAATASYRTLLSKLAALKGGRKHAVDIVAVQCNQHEGQAQRQLQRLERLEAHVRDYERHVWEPLLEQGLPQSSASATAGGRAQSYRPAANSDAASPFVPLVEELSRRLESVATELRELEDTLVRPGHPLPSLGAAERAGHRATSAIPNDAIAQINASLLYELDQLRDCSSVAARLHSRTDAARELFTRSYGQTEADVLFADTEALRSGLAGLRRPTAAASTHFDIPPLPQQSQPSATPAGAPATAATAAAAPATLGGFGAKPAAATGGFGAAPATTTGFGAAPAASAAAAGSGGFGAAATPAATAAAPTAAAAPATGGFGFGAPAASATTATAAATPAAGGFGAPSTAAPGAAPAAPAMGPASPAGAPTSLSLGGSAVGTVGFGAGPGKAAAGSDDRPTRRVR